MLKIYYLLSREYLSRSMGNEIIEVLTALIYQIYNVEKDECNVLADWGSLQEITELKQMEWSRQICRFMEASLKLQDGIEFGQNAWEIVIPPTQVHPADEILLSSSKAACSETPRPRQRCCSYISRGQARRHLSSRVHQSETLYHPHDRAVVPNTVWLLEIQDEHLFWNGEI